MKAGIHSTPHVLEFCHPEVHSLEDKKHTERIYVDSDGRRRDVNAQNEDPRKEKQVVWGNGAS